MEKIQKATHQGELHIGNLTIPCAVLEDGRRVLSGRGMTKAIGMKGRGQGVTRITTHKALNPFISNELSLAIENPILYTGYSPKGTPTQGFEATILQEVCDSILTARDAGVLKTAQELRYALYADTLIRSFAKIGIIALVDEATGYQEVRDRLALAKILDKYIRGEYRTWTRTFPPDFYKEMFRLKDWPYDERFIKRPSVIGHYTNDIVYSRLAPGVLTKLREKNPTTEKGYRKRRHHQWLTDNVGIPELKEHIIGIIALMKAAPNWRKFKEMANRVYAKYGDTIPMDLDEG